MSTFALNETSNVIKKIAGCKFVWVVAPQQAVAMRDRAAGHQVRTDFPTYIPRSSTSTTHHYYYYYYLGVTLEETSYCR